MAVTDYSTTPSANTAINTIDISEGCSPKGLNDAIRQMMADIRTDHDALVLPMNGATATSAGASGRVPAPAAGEQEKLLTGGGKFVNQYTNVQAAHASLPSDSVVALSLPASGGTMTSPGDGYVYLMATAGAAGQGIILICNGISASCFSHASSDSLRVCLPVKQGKVITVIYTTTGGSSAFSFKRCEGAV